jgi:histidyl-tRNA synthetase
MEQSDIVEDFVSLSGSNQEKLDELEKMFGNIEAGKQGIHELKSLLSSYESIPGKKAELNIDLSLARGLNYYTGTIFEIKALHVQMGSIGGGGRYDDLTGLFGVKGIAGVGISFGVDRIYDVMEESKVFPESIQKGTEVLFFHTGEKELMHILPMAESLRTTGISAEIFHEAAKFDKQFKYAEKKGIQKVIIIGSKEIENGTLLIKNLTTGIQKEIKKEQLISEIR